MKRWLFVLLLSSSAGCLWGEGLDYDELHVSALRADGSPATSVPHDGCVTLPLLLGSRIEETVTIASQLLVDVSATRDRARVRISGGALGSETRTILARDLRNPNFSDEVAFYQDGNLAFTLYLRSNCPSSGATAE
jgi:hypothetical protein